MKKTIKSLLLSLTLSVIPCLLLASCSDDDGPDAAPSLSEDYSGTYSGTITLNVAGQYTYTTDISCVITEGDDETVTVRFPDYFLAGTMMGDMTLGSVTVAGLAYDNTMGGFYRSYGGEGITQTMNGTTYPLNDPSSMLVIKDSNGTLTIDNPFTLGKMPLPLTATFTGRKSTR